MNAHCRCCAVFLAIALGLTGCATTPVNAPSPLASAVTEAYAALNCAPISLAAYNAAVRKICVALATSGPRESFSHLKDLGVSLVLPKIPLRLRSIEISAPLRGVVERSAGIPVVLEYDTKAALLFPPEGLFVDGSVLYERSPGGAKVKVRTESGDIVLNGKRFQLARNPIGAGHQLEERAQRLAKSGFISMIRPAAMPRKPQIYLLDPYDPDPKSDDLLRGAERVARDEKRDPGTGYSGRMRLFRILVGPSQNSPRQRPCCRVANTPRFYRRTSHEKATSSFLKFATPEAVERSSNSFHATIRGLWPRNQNQTERLNI